MKAIGMVLMVLSLAGCATSKYAYDSRAAILGPEYLDAIAANPPDRDTEYYAPNFAVRGLGRWADPYSSVDSTLLLPKIEALLVQAPAPSAPVRDIAGQGYPRLEETGLPLFTAGHE